MAVLYLIQNDTHLKNFCKKITELDYFIDVGRLTGQRLNLDEIECGSEVVIHSKSVNFYSMGALQRALFLVGFRFKNKHIFKSINVSHVVVGNDGAIQKLIVESLGDGLAVVDMWLDGIIDLNDRYRVNLIKIVLGRIAERLGCAYLFPSVIGAYSRIRMLYVMDKSVKDEYSKFCRFIDSDKVQVTLFPRHKLLMSVARRFEQEGGRKPIRRILYLTSAWRFHGHEKEHGFQVKHVEALLNAFESHKVYKLFVRVHPRENEADYAFVPRDSISNFMSYEEDLCSSDVVVSARSTGLFEANKIGKSVLIYNESFGLRFLNGFLKKLNRVEAVDELLSTLDGANDA